MKTSIKEAYDSLYGYFGLRSRDGYLNAADANIQTNENNSPKVSISDVYQLIYGDENKNHSIGEIAKVMTDSSMPYEAMSKIFCITPYEAGLDPQKVPLNGQVSGYSEQGTEKHGKPAPNRPYYLSSLLQQKDGSANLNKVSAIQVFPASSVPELADTEVLTLFMSTINSVNMSQAVPYVDVSVAVGNGESTKPGSNTKPEDFFSMGKFLNFSMTNDPLQNSEFVGDNKDNGASIVSSMEIFTSPQTMVNAEDVKYNENSAIQSPIDKFRPFMAIESINFNVVSANAGLIAFKTANAKLRLFDRGRLSDISPIVAPSKFGLVRFDIEYGWSHPGGATNTRGRMADANSDRIGQLIDAMRVKESYQVINSNFTFEQDGSVSIDLKLSMLGSAGWSSIEVPLATSGIDTSELVEQLQKFREQYSNLQGGKSKNLGSISILNSDADTLMKLPPEKINEIKKSIEKFKKGEGSKAAALVSIAAGVLGKGKGNEGSLSKLQHSRKAAASQFISQLMEKEDPFLRTKGISGSGVTGAEIQNGDYVSLGKLLVMTLGPIFQKMGETIFIFSCFNKDAAAMFDHNIAQFPIRVNPVGSKKIVNLRSSLERLLTKNAKITPENLLAMINEDFLLRIGTEAYGMQALYNPPERTEKEEVVKDVMKEKFNKESEKESGGTLQSEIEQEKILSSIYKGQRAKLSVTIPRIALKIDTKPSSENGTVSRIIVMDQAASNFGDVYDVLDELNNSGMVEATPGDSTANEKDVRHCNHGDSLNAAITQLTSSKEGIVEHFTEFDKFKSKLNELGFKEDFKNTLGEDKIKNFYFMKEGAREKLKKIFYTLSPTLIYGSMGSGIVSAQLSSNQNDALTTIMLQKQPDQTPSMPMIIHPTQLSMEVIGTPLFKYSQKFFVDFGTGTSADNFYVVTGVDMSFAPGEFKTTLKMTLLDAYGKFMRVRNEAMKTAMIAVYNELKKPQTTNKK